jgi:hypothetical protein
MSYTTGMKYSSPLPDATDKKMAFRKQLEREIAAATTFRSGISSRELLGKAWSSMKEAAGKLQNGNGDQAEPAPAPPAPKSK